MNIIGTRQYRVHITLVDGTEFDAIVSDWDWENFYGFLEANDAVKSYSSYYEEV